jgi:2-polyprenyl-3-methyl-5-hydroxy-6-metoxy-1,4-benzoquinol methylase
MLIDSKGKDMQPAQQPHAPNQTGGPAYVTRDSCALCAARSFKTLRRIDQFPIMECLACGFMQTGQLLDPASMAELYRSGYAGTRQQQGQLVNAEVNFALLKACGLIRPGARMLDIGCGYGFLLDRLRRGLGLEVTGVELSQSETEYARATLNLDVRGGIEAFTEETFDCIGMWEVIEHIAEPVAFLQTVMKRLKPGGILSLTTDNFRSKIVDRLGDRFPKWIPHQHVSLFDPASLRRLINAMGNLKVEATYSFTPWELEAQGFVSLVTNGRRGGRQYRLADQSEAETSRPYPLFETRRALNAVWALVTKRSDLEGELMTIVARKM